MELLSDASTDPTHYEEVEHKLFDMMEKDAYFQCLHLDPQHVHTLGHLQRTREHADFSANSDDVNSQFDLHEFALDKMLGLCGALKSTATEWRSTSKALVKAKSLERKAYTTEQKRIEKKKEAAEKKKQRQVDALQKAREEKARAEAEKMEADPNGDGGQKKRRIASKLTSELTTTDPHVLQDRFPTKQISIVESLDSWCAIIIILSSIKMNL